MKLKKTYASTVLALLLLLGATGGALAQGNTAVGLWRVTVFNDLTPNLSFQGLQEICIRPDRTWHGTTLPGWGGFWFQKGLNTAGNGNHVALVGNFVFAGGEVNDAVDLDFVNSDLMTGTWRDWQDGFVVIFWLRADLARVARECGPAPTLSPEAAAAAAKSPRGPFDQPPKP